MMPKPNPNKSNKHVNRSEFDTMASEKILLETKPSFWLYSDNFILKIIVLFLLVFMFAPVMTFVYTLHGELVENFHIMVDNVMFYTELILFLLILVVVIKLILDVLDWNYTNYVFTDSRIVIQRGFIHKEKLIMSYNKIQDIEIKQSLLERIINVGDIIIYGANEMSETILDDIPSPKKAEEIILSRMNAIGYAQQNAYNNYQQSPYNQPNFQQQPTYQQNPYVQQQVIYNQQPNYQHITEDYIQPDHVQYNSEYDDEVIIPEKGEENWEYNNHSSRQLDKKEIIEKHNRMFKRHKK